MSHRDEIALEAADCNPNRRPSTTGTMTLRNKSKVKHRDAGPDAPTGIVQRKLKPQTGAPNRVRVLWPNGSESDVNASALIKVRR